MDWKTALVVVTLLYYVDGYSKYGRTCKDIGCLRNEVCVLAEDPCSFGHTSGCGTYPTCKKASKVEGSHSEPHTPSIPKPAPQTPTNDFDSAPHYPPPAPPSNGHNSPYGGNSQGGGSPYGGNAHHGGSSPYGGNSPYGGSSSNGGGSPYGGSSPYGGGSPYGGSSPYGGNSPYGGGSSNGGSSPYGGQSPYGGSSPYGSNGGGSPYGDSSNRGGSPYGGNSPYGGSSSNNGFGGSGGKGALDTIFNTLNKFANGQGGGSSGGSSGTGLSNIFGNILGNLSKSGGGLNGLFDTRPITENRDYALYSSNSRNSPSGNTAQPYQPTQNKKYGQSYAQHSGAATRKPASYGWNVSVTVILTLLVRLYTSQM